MASPLTRSEEREHGPPGVKGPPALAEELGRHRGSVTWDVKKLKSYGLLRLQEEVNPGHGVVRIVEPTAERCEMRITF